MRYLCVHTYAVGRVMRFRSFYATLCEVPKNRILCVLAGSYAYVMHNYSVESYRENDPDLGKEHAFSPAK